MAMKVSDLGKVISLKTKQVLGFDDVFKTEDDTPSVKDEDVLPTSYPKDKGNYEDDYIPSLLAQSYMGKQKRLITEMRRYASIEHELDKVTSEEVVLHNGNTATSLELKDTKLEIMLYQDGTWAFFNIDK